MADLDALVRNETAAYRTRTPESAAWFDRACHAMPGGDTRTGTFHPPYPLFIARGDGCYLWDADGHRYVDTLYNFTSLLHGHAWPPAVEAIRRQAALGTAHGTANELQVRLAEAIRTRVPSLERLRFCSSGTEATMGALRAARAFTGRPAVMKMAGGYHGSHDVAAIGMSAPYDATPPGVARAVADDVIVGWFNDLDRTADLIREYRHRLAAVIVEPLLGSGAIVADATFLRGLRDVTRACGVLLVLDEVITFRLAVGGLQQVVEVNPDLSSFGKIIGGGLPVGAFGGRADVMAAFDPSRHGAIQHSGTYNGNATTMAAGLATLERFDAAAVDMVNVAGDALRARLNASIARRGLDGVVIGYGSLMQLHFTTPAPTSPTEAARSDKRLVSLMHLALANRGVFSSTRQLYVLPTVITPEALATFEQAFHDALAVVAEAHTAAAGHR